jgi:hypothetical protein
MNNIINIKNVNFKNYVLSKNNIPVFYTYYNNIDQIKYIFIHNNKFVNYDIKKMNNMIAIPINFSNNLYEINFENKMLLIRSKDFYRWLYIYNKFEYFCKKGIGNYCKYWNFITFLKYYKIYFIIL